VKAKPEQKRSLFAAASIYTGLQAPGYVPNAGCLRTVAAVLIYYTPYDISFVMDATENRPCFHQSIIFHFHAFKSVDPLFIGCEITPHHNPYIMVLFFLPTNLLNPSPP
jgi:hypothetical protein